MSTFLDNNRQLGEEEVVKIASDCLQQKVKLISKLGGGRNSRVYHVACSAQEYVAKFYFQHASDFRDRSGIEFKSFSFLWDQGLRVIPRPVALYTEHQCAFYEFIKGQPPAKDISRKDIDGAVYFVDVLKNLSARGAGFKFDGASEAFFCGRDVVNSLRERLKRLCFQQKDGEYLALQEYLRDEFLPLLKEVEAWSKEYLCGHGTMWDKEIPGHHRTLSPSDFGFHNALRTSAGTMVFLDFEYFGWDDPAKLVSDFLWHPAMDICEELKAYFVRRMTAVFDNDPDFKNRLKGIFPLFGLKWCLILLNEFVVTELRRREFAHPQVKDMTDLRLRQLMKAKCLNQRIKAMYRNFPYEC